MNGIFLVLLALLIAAALFEAVVHTLRRDHDWLFTMMLYGLAVLGSWEAVAVGVQVLDGWWCECALTDYSAQWAPFGIALIVALVAASIVLFDHAEFSVSLEDRTHAHPHVAATLGYAFSFGSGALALHLVQALGWGA